MAISKYNTALDFTVLALAHAVNGDMERAGRLMVKASKAPDVTAAVAILEASNQQAYEGEQRAKRKLAAKTTKPAAKVAASRVKAAKVVAFDMGDEDDMDELIEEDDVEVDAAEDEDGADISDDEDDTEQDEEDGDFDKAFASVLKGMKGKRK